MKQETQTKNPANSRDGFYCEEPVEIRAIGDDVEGSEGKLVVRGYAALFDVRSREMKSWRGKRFVEIIKPGAFDGCDFSDMECRFNHQRFIAATPTLKFGIDARGLWYEYEHDPADPDHVATIRKIQRGDSKGSSFMFTEPDEQDQEVALEGSVYVRSISKIRKVWDCGPVVRPAYRQTTATAFMRSLDELPDAEGEVDGDGAGSPERIVDIVDDSVDAGGVEQQEGAGEDEEGAEARAILEKRKQEVRGTLI